MRQLIGTLKGKRIIPDWQQVEAVICRVVRSGQLNSLKTWMTICFSGFCRTRITVFTLCCQIVGQNWVELRPRSHDRELAP